MAYVLGDMLKKGNILMRQEEARILREHGYEVYSAIEQKDINNKEKQTVESNNTLAERIYAKDMNAIRRSDLIIADVDNDSVGSSVEVGAIAEFNWFWGNIRYIRDNSKNLEHDLDFFLDQYPLKEVYFHTTDIRHTNLPEIGTRRSFSINQFLHGACLYLSNLGIRTFNEIIETISKKK